MVPQVRGPLLADNLGIWFYQSETSNCFVLKNLTCKSFVMRQLAEPARQVADFRQVKDSRGEGYPPVSCGAERMARKSGAGALAREEPAVGSLRSKGRNLTTSN